MPGSEARSPYVAGQEDDPGVRSRHIVELGVLLAGLLGLIALSRGNDLLFHTVAELFSVGVAWAIFLLVWNSRRVAGNDSIVLLGTAYLFVGILDLCHALGSQGMPRISAAAPVDAATQLRVIARVMESVGLLLFALLLGRRIRVGLTFIAFAVTTAAALSAVLLFGVFPTCHVAGVGLTAFKIGAEVVACVLLLAAIVLLHRNRSRFDALVYRLIVSATIVTILAGLSFATHADAQGLGNTIGHCLKVVSFVLVYRALVRAGISSPFAVLCRDLRTAEEDLRRSRDLLALRHRVAEALLRSPDGDEFDAVREIALEEFRSREWILVDADGSRCPVVSTEGTSDGACDSGRDLPGFWARALAGRSTRIENDPVPRLSGEGRLSRALAVPLASGETCLGLVAVGDGIEPYTDEDARRLEAVGMVIGPFLAERSARSREERGRLRAQELLELAVRGTAAALWDWSVQTGECVFNERWAEMLGFEHEDSAGAQDRTWQEFCHPTDLRLAEKQLEKCFARELEDFDCECRLRHRDGRYVWTSIRARVAEWNENGEPVRMIGTLLDVTDRKIAEEELERQQSRLRELALRLMRAEERERHRLANSLHDGIGQSLALLQMKLLELARRPDSLPEALGTSLDLLGAAVRDTRALTYDLSPPMLYELGLGPALEWLAEHLTDRFSCHIACETITEDQPLDRDIRALLFRQARELVLNAIKHADAGSILISLATPEGEIVLTIEDDGVGIPEGGPDKGFGLYSVEQQVAHMGGRLSVESRSGGGTRITIRLLLSFDPESGEYRLAGFRNSAY